MKPCQQVNIDVSEDPAAAILRVFQPPGVQLTRKPWFDIPEDEGKVLQHGVITQKTWVLTNTATWISRLAECVVTINPANDMNICNRKRETYFESEIRALIYLTVPLSNWNSSGETFPLSRPPNKHAKFQGPRASPTTFHSHRIPSRVCSRVLVNWKGLVSPQYDLTCCRGVELAGRTSLSEMHPAHIAYCKLRIRTLVW
jgi:hypothetical protein